jgi:hypothetical protein
MGPKIFFISHMSSRRMLSIGGKKEGGGSLLKEGKIG